ncbi:MAG: type I-E CRISPR-associated protein Cse1/CasA [Solidesulfovibrio sp. DCME]|uniref:type I-E CRISPR-associated protein Cse1/CasA n=1 Tax=Solidesulfovibrio sp. DCME TaxID=3447380 RepID=UPI003D0F3BB7
MDHPVTQIAYNLLEEKWIPVLYCDGKVDRVGICQALTDAHTIRQLVASNPMDRVALLRFLLAVLLWCKEDVKSCLSALDEERTGIPNNWLAKLKENKPAFNLLGNGKRFYQDGSLKSKKTRPIGDLLVEFPGANSVNHMRHVVYGNSSCGFCPACCAMGILRFSVWAPANGSYDASVNPGSAAYAFIEGKNLCQTFCANLPATNPRTDQAPWLENGPSDSPDAVAKFAWRPRKLWLNVEDSDYHCACCGQTGILATSLCIENGWPTPVTTGQQFCKDVLLEFQQLNSDYKAKKTDKRKLADKVVKISPIVFKCRMSALSQADSNAAQAPENESSEEKIARIFDQLYAAGNKKLIQELTRNPTKEEKSLLDQQDIRAKKFWDADPHLLVDGEAVSLPRLGADVAVHASQFWRNALRLQRVQAGSVTAIGPIVNKFTFQDCVSVRLPDASDDVQSRAKLSADCCGELQALLKQVTQNPQRQHPEIDASLKLLTPSVENQIRDILGRRNALTGDNATEDKAFLHKVYAPMVDLAVASVTPGSPLRRHAARNCAQALLNKTLEDFFEKKYHMSNAGTPAAMSSKSKRERKKGSSK